jgi:hypothetical protein
VETERHPGDDDKARETEASEVEGVEKRVGDSIKEEKISWQLLYQLASWSRLAPTDYPLKHASGRRHLLQALETFRKQDGGIEVVIFPPVGGTYLTKSTGQLQIAFQDSGIKFDWSEARRLIFGIDALAEEARDWWRERGEGEGRRLTRLWRQVLRAFGSGSAGEERRPHSMRAYSLATWVLGAIEMENDKHDPPAKGKPRGRPGREYHSQLVNLDHEFAAARAQFRKAGQRNAQSRYTLGMLVGASALSILTAIVLGTFWIWTVPAQYAIAMPAGGIGAIVSVLQRMSTGKLVLDSDAGRDMIEFFGAVRPFIGAIFGLALMALLIGGLLLPVEIPTGDALPFFAGIGFLAGFNERWAQDMLKTSTDTIDGARQSAEGIAG